MGDQIMKRLLNCTVALLAAIGGTVLTAMEPVGQIIRNPYYHAAPAAAPPATPAMSWPMMPDSTRATASDYYATPQQAAPLNLTSMTERTSQGPTFQITSSSTAMQALGAAVGPAHMPKPPQAAPQTFVPTSDARPMSADSALQIVRDEAVVRTSVSGEWQRPVALPATVRREGTEALATAVAARLEVTRLSANPLRDREASDIAGPPRTRLTTGNPLR